jgi:bacillolysin
LQPYNSQLIYVDANNGDIINNGSLIYNSNISCTADTKYSGTKNIMGDLYSGPWIRLQENRNGVTIHTMNLNDGFDFPNASEFRNSNTNWTSGSWDTFGQDQWALDAHWNAEMVLDFWNTVFQRNSINNNGLRLLSYVHYSRYTGYDDAYAGWDDDPLKLWALFGDGDNSRKPFTSLDICAHEFGHGITQFTSQLYHSTTESGALNEGFSDIWGACVEHWAAPNKQTWLMGEDLFSPGTIICERSLQDPKSTANWESHEPDTYHGLYWDYNGEPHNNSTVLSHWFYLLSQGGSGTNDIGHSYEVYGINIDVAQKIAYQGEKRLYPTADFAAAQEQTINAADSDLYPIEPLEVMQVRNAWYAVGIGTQPTQMTISGSTLVCSSGTTFTLNNVPSGCTVLWNQSSNLALLSASGNTATFAAGYGANSAGWIQAVVYSPTYGTTATGPHHTVWAGTPALTSISGPNPPVGYTGTQLSFWTNPSRESQPLSQAQYEWQVQPSYYNYYFNYQYYDWATITFYDPCEYYQVMARATNTCGPSNWQNKMVAIYSGYFFSVSPNPASEEVQVTISGTNSSAIATDNKVPEFNVQICDLYGKIYYTEKKTGLYFTLPVSNLKDGTYLINFSCDKEKKSLPLIIKH